MLRLCEKALRLKRYLTSWSFKAYFCVKIEQMDGSGFCHNQARQKKDVIFTLQRCSFIQQQSNYVFF
jgi:hypothetical protein